jgi:hypothetical protein
MTGSALDALAQGEQLRNGRSGTTGLIDSHEAALRLLEIPAHLSALERSQARS